MFKMESKTYVFENEVQNYKWAYTFVWKTHAINEKGVLNSDSLCICP